VKWYNSRQESTGNTLCVITCTVGSAPGFVLDADENTYDAGITCNNEYTLFPESGSVDFSCAETPCGKLAEKTTINETVISTCTESGCEFSCATADLMPSFAELGCGDDPKLGYEHYDGSDTKVLGSKG
jgi:hypothetical protein